VATTYQRSSAKIGRSVIRRIRCVLVRSLLFDRRAFAIVNLQICCEVQFYILILFLKPTEIYESAIFYTIVKYFYVSLKFNL